MGEALSITDLGFRYAAAGPWVVDIDALSLEAGEQLLLTGRSGRGKSTLLYLIAGLMEPGRGRVLVHGQDMHALRGHHRDEFRGRAVGMIFQTFNLLHGFSAAENVMLAMMFSDIPRAEHAKRAHDLLAHLGVDRPDAPPEQLSIGQQQRVAVARAVACRPALVLADEPTASLDPENAGGAMDLIQGACRDTGAALLCVSHDPTMAERFRRRASLDALGAETQR
ncbi:MAG: ABC transporter ATP-binding protein [Phycisphaerales bacterium]|nr:ABC transporter ATP-binding protein [Phycisphaerales bacterium]